MRIHDLRVANDAAVGLECVQIPIVCAVAQDFQPCAVHIPFNGTTRWRLMGARYFHKAKTAGWSLELCRLKRGTNEGVVKGTAGLIVTAAAEKFKIASPLLTWNGTTFVKKAATDNLVFTAAHVVTALKFGIILIELDDDGSVDTRVPAATPTTAMAYDDAATALATLPTLIAASLAAGSVPIGYLEIEADAGNWTANTDDLTDASDLTTAAFTSFDGVKLSPNGDGAGAGLANLQDLAEWTYNDDGELDDVAALTPTAIAEIGALSADPVAVSLGAADDFIAAIVTTDADGANTDAQLTLYLRPYPMHGEPA